MVKLEYQNTDPRRAESTAIALAAKLREWIRQENSRIDMIGPVPCFFTRLYGRYRWQIILKGQDPTRLLRNRPLTDWMIEVDPSSLL